MRKAALIGLIALVLGAGFCLIILARHDWDPMAFVSVGTRFADNDPAGTTGYDGQFTFYIATQGRQAQEQMDNAAFRFARILYPLLAWALAGGQAAWVPWSMLLINLAALAGGTALLASLLERANSPPIYALIFPLWVGTLFALRLDLNELLALALIAGALVAWKHDRVWLAAGLCGLGGLAKELALVCAISLVLTSWWEKRWRQGFGVGLLSVTPYLVWVLLLALWLGQTPFDAHMSHVQWVPLQGMQATPAGIARWILLLWLGLPAIGMGVLGIASLLRRPTKPLDAWFMLVAAWFVLALPRPTYQDPVAALRVASIMQVAAIPFTGAHYPRLLPFLAALWGPACLLLFFIPGLL